MIIQVLKKILMITNENKYIFILLIFYQLNKI